jgi:hypothetical protein
VSDIPCASINLVGIEVFPNVVVVFQNQQDEEFEQIRLGLESIKTTGGRKLTPTKTY